MINTAAGVVHVPLLIRIDTVRQRMDLLKEGKLFKSYPVSTSKFGFGFDLGSNRTPLGSFAVWKKIGAGVPMGAVFKNRIPTGEIASQGGEQDLILTRVLWLDGVEESNANTKDRFIYIHGTNQEALLGTPASHGCIRMSNADIAECFEQIAEGTPVEIVA
jgi:L,D-transpeptidase YbiS